MKNNILKSLFALLTINVFSQVGINTSSPKTTLDVVGKSDDITHYDGIMPPRITGDQLARKIYSPEQKGAFIFVTQAATNLSGQVIHVVAEGYYFFNGSYWTQILNEPTYYDALIILDETMPINTISTQESWNHYSPYPTNPRQHTQSVRLYRLGTLGLGISGQIDARRIGTMGYLDVSIVCSAPFISNYQILDLKRPLSDLGFMSSGSTDSISNILITGASASNRQEIELGTISLTNVEFKLVLWKNQIEKFNGKISGMITFPINYLNVRN